MPDHTREPCFYEVVVKADTALAILCALDDDDHPANWVWIPKSELMDDGDSLRQKGDEGTIAIPRWLAEQKGLE